MQPILSPLRYPGGKIKLYNYTKQLIEENNLTGCTYVEPFAGGSGLALQLLHTKVANNIILNDIDKSIYSFWHTVLNDHEKLVDKINQTEITIDEWHKQKEIQMNKEKTDEFDLAFSTLFLNRTNRSGILNAGPIGGKNQDGNYKLDCRFNKSDIINRIKLINSFKDKIKFYNLDAIEFIDTLDKLKNDIFIFLDPPYFQKGQSLYTNYYENKDHIVLAKKIEKLNHKWILTYDNAEEIKKIYQNFSSQQFSLNYSAQRKYKGTEIMFYSNNLLIV